MKNIELNRHLFRRNEGFFPAEYKSNKEKAFCIEKVKEVQFRVNYRTSVTSPKISFEDFFFGEWWEEASKTNCAPTMQDYRNYFNRSLKNLIGNVPLEKITPNTLNGVYAALKDDGKSDSYSLLPNNLQ